MEHLISPEWFSGASKLVLLLVTGAAMAVLVKGAGFLVEGASGLATLLGMPKVIVGATIVALGTTSPECAVSVTAAWAGEAGLALGNAVGSIIADTAFIFGVGCLLSALPADRFVLSRQGWVQFGAATLLAATCYAVFVSQGDAAQLGHGIGFLYLTLLVAYLVVSVKWSRRHPHGELFQVPEETTDGGAGFAPARRGILLLAGIVVFGLAVVVLSSHVLILSVSELARLWRIPDVVIAGTLVAFGTSLPELVVGITAIRKGHPELLVGNVIGADILNVLFVVGASAVAAPLPIIDATARLPTIFLWVHLPAMMLVLVLFRSFIFVAVRRGHFGRWMGWPLVVIYVAYVVVQYLVS